MPRQLPGGFAVILTLSAVVNGQQADPPPGDQPVPSAQTVPDSEKKKAEEPEVAVQVSGKVVDRSGKGLVNADVTVKGPRGSATMKTGSAGTFVFEVKPGKYTITAKASGKSVSIVAELSKSTELKPLVLNTEE